MKFNWLPWVTIQGSMGAPNDKLFTASMGGQGPKNRAGTIPTPRCVDIGLTTNRIYEPEAQNQCPPHWYGTPPLIFLLQTIYNNCPKLLPENSRIDPGPTHKMSKNRKPKNYPWLTPEFPQVALKILVSRPTMSDVWRFMSSSFNFNRTMNLFWEYFDATQ